MKYLHRLLAVASAAFFIASSALAQNTGTVTNRAFAIGKGAGQTGFTSLLCASTQIAIGQTAANPACFALSGDITMNASGVAAIGATKVTSAMLNADVYSTAHTWSGQQTLVAPILGAATATTINGLTIANNGANSLNIANGTALTSNVSVTLGGTASSLTLQGSGTVVNRDSADTLTNKTFDTAGTGNSFSINGVAVTANTGTGAVVRATSPVLITPALGTPASGTLTNATGLPISTGVSGLGTGCATFLGTPSSANLRGCLTDEVGTGAAYFIGGALGTPASATLTNATGLPLSGHTAQAAWSFVVNNTSGSAAPTAVDIPSFTAKASPAGTDLIVISDQAASGALKRATISSIASAGSVSSIAGNTGAFTLGIGLTNSVNDIRIDHPRFTNSLGADVAMNNVSNYFTGPTVAQGTSGTWYASGSVTMLDTSTAAAFICKLWDGTTVIASGRSTSTGASNPTTISLSGYITSPAGNINIACRDSASTSGQITFNNSGNSKDSTISAFRIQ